MQAEPEADGSWIRPGYYARPYGLIHAPLVKPSLVATRGSHLRYYGYPYRVLGKREAEGEAEATPEAEAEPAKAVFGPVGPVHAAVGPFVATRRGFRVSLLLYRTEHFLKRITQPSRNLFFRTLPSKVSLKMLMAMVSSTPLHRWERPSPPLSTEDITLTATDFGRGMLRLNLRLRLILRLILITCMVDTMDMV